MNVLVACEESQAVTVELRKLGHRAFSCDIIECSGGHPEWHIMADCLPLLNGDCSFRTMDGVSHEQRGGWDMIIAFPPCTHLAVSGARWFAEKQKDLRQQKAVAFFMHFVLAHCDRIAVENPIGIMSSVYRKPDQIVQPFEYGDPARKSTCIWVKGLPLLVPTNVVGAGPIRKGGYSIGASLDYARVDGRALAWNDPLTARIRSKTFPGIAKAMAEQWAGPANKEDNYHEKE